MQVVRLAVCPSVVRPLMPIRDHDVSSLSGEISTKLITTTFIIRMGIAEKVFKVEVKGQGHTICYNGGGRHFDSHRRSQEFFLLRGALIDVVSFSGCRTKGDGSGGLSPPPTLQKIIELFYVEMAYSSTSYACL